MEVKDCLVRGAQDAITAAEVGMLTGMPEGAVHSEIERLRQRGLPVCRLPEGGYYLAPPHKMAGEGDAK